MPNNRLPLPGSDNGNWGTLLNDYLKQISPGVNGGLIAVPIDPATSPRTGLVLSSIDEGYTIINTTENKLKKWSGGSWVTVLSGGVGIGGATDVYPYLVVGASQSQFVTDGVDDNIQIQAAIDYAGALPNGGTVLIKAGKYQINSTIIIKAKVSIMGEGIYNTILTSKNGLNSDLMRTDNFAVETQTGATLSSTYKFSISNLQLDGNDSGQTRQAAGISEQIRTALIKIYGYDYVLDNLYLANSPENSIYAEYGYNPSLTTLQKEEIGASFTNIKIKNFRNNGVVFRGPAKSSFTTISSSSYQRIPAETKANNHFLLDINKTAGYYPTNLSIDNYQMDGETLVSAISIKKWINPGTPTDIAKASLVATNVFINTITPIAIVLETDETKLEGRLTGPASSSLACRVDGNYNDVKVQILSGFANGIKLSSSSSYNILSLPSGRGVTAVYDLTETDARSGNYYFASCNMDQAGKLFKNDVYPNTTEWGQCYNQGIPLIDSSSWMVTPETNTLATISGTTVVDLSKEAVQLYLTQSTTLSLKNPRDGMSYTIQCQQDVFGGKGITWPANISWQGGNVPIITSGANKIDFITLRYNRNQNKFYGSYSQNYNA
jgi:hypothetical protein